MERRVEMIADITGIKTKLKKGTRIQFVSRFYPDTLSNKRREIYGIDLNSGRDLNLLKGKVLYNSIKGHGFMVEFDENIHGHSASGRGKDGHCWCFPYTILDQVNIYILKKTNHNYF